MDPVRVDRYLWAIRLFSSRTSSTESCRSGHIRVNGSRAKPATEVRAGDRIDVRLPAGRSRVVEVIDPIPNRVSASLAVLAYRDLTPPPPPRNAELPQGVRERSSGRPTKRDRRLLDRARRR
ncbi:MAG: RNA-binding S4 domain-containing protein [Acidimicrobiales bacterium]